MAFDVTITGCTGGERVTGATLGNGNCYTEMGNGVYRFQSCDHLAACAGNSDATCTLTTYDSNPLPASGGTATFTVYAYGNSSLAVTKNKSGGTTSTSWSGTGYYNFTCPSSMTITLNALANTSTTSSVTYQLNACGHTASITQSAATPGPTYRSVTIYGTTPIWCNRTSGTSYLAYLSVTLDFSANGTSKNMTWERSSQITTGTPFPAAPAQSNQYITFDSIPTTQYDIDVSLLYLSYGTGTLTKTIKISVPAGGNTTLYFTDCGSSTSPIVTFS